MTTCFGEFYQLSNMAGNNDRRSESSSFKLFPAVHEDDLRARYENRHAYDLTQCVRKKRKSGPRKTKRGNGTQENTSDHSCLQDRDARDVFQPTPIFDSLLDVSDNEDLTCSETSTCTSSAVSSLFTYVTLLGNGSAVTFPDRNCLYFTFPEFDEVTNKLHESKYVFLKREPRDGVWMYKCGCKASTRRTDYLEALSISVNRERFLAAESVYGKCLHTQAIQDLMQEFDAENGLSPASHPDNSHLSLDHSYQVVSSGNFLPVSGGQFTVFVAGDRDDGVVGLKGGSMACFTCDCQTHNCEHVLKLTASEEELVHEMPDFLVDFFSEKNFRSSPAVSTASRKEWLIKPVSEKKILFDLTASQKETFAALEEVLLSKQAPTGLVQFIPELSATPECPKCSSRCIEQCSRQTLCFLKKKVFQCEVFHFNCANPTCDGRLEFDGAELTLLNMGSYLLSYEVLRDFMFHFLKGRCTLFTYYSVWQEIMHDASVLDFQRLLSYHHWRFGWYSFLDLLDINYSEGFCCPICGSGDLDTAVCDATALSFRQELCHSIKNISSHSNQSGRRSTGPRGIGRHRDRVYLAEKYVRSMVDKVGRDVSGVDETTMVSLHVELQRCAPPLDGFLTWCISTFGTDIPFPPAISALFIALGKPSPVCALLPQFESLDSLYKKLVDNVPVKQSPGDLLLLQQSCPLLFDTISLVEGDNLPSALCGLISDLLEKAKAPFNVDSLADTGSQEIIHLQDLEYFPCLPVVRSRGSFCFDCHAPSDICTKRSTRHPALLPGMFLVHCKHGITYGFSVIHSNESPNVPFILFRMRFSRAPRVIVYDNACNLHAYSLNRDPLFFKNTQFLVDRLHWRDHTGCSEAYNLSRYPQWDTLNSQAAEQANSSLKYVKGSLSYMNQKNFINHCKFFIWYRNLQRRKQMSP